jgi:hypothetical protein
MTTKPKVAKEVDKSLIPTSHAVQLVAKRLVSHEQMCARQFKSLEEKIGEHENTFTENNHEEKYESMIELIRNLSKQINAMGQRCEVLEKQNNIKAPKKKGTMPLADVGEPSFSTLLDE